MEYKSKGFGRERVWADYRIVWERGGWRKYEKKDSKSPSKGEKKGWVEIESAETGMAEVPLIPFYGIYDRAGLGWPVTLDVLDHCIAIYNKYSDRDYGEFQSNNPIPCIISGAPPTAVSVAYGMGIHIDSRKGAADAKYLEHSGSGLTASLDSEKNLIARIRDIAEYQAKRDTAQVQSADSQKEERWLFRSSLHSASGMYESGELECWRLAAKWRGVGTIEEDAVQYSRDFSEDTVNEVFLETFSTMTERQQMSRELLLETMEKLRDRGLLPKDFDPKREINRILAEQESFAMPKPNDPSLDAEENEEEEEPEELENLEEPNVQSE
jgi:hypothetical protein